MTDIVQPSPHPSTARSYVVAGAIKYAGGSESWIVPDTKDHFATYITDLNDGPLDAFSGSWSSSSLDVTINTGEGYVVGKYLARDTTTTVTLAASTTDQTVYVGYPADSADSVIIGLSGDFGADHEKTPLYTFDTDGSGVTNATDERVTSEPSSTFTVEDNDTVQGNDASVLDFKSNLSVNYSSGEAEISIDQGPGSGLDADTWDGDDQSDFRQQKPNLHFKGSRIPDGEHVYQIISAGSNDLKIWLWGCMRDDFTTHTDLRISVYDSSGTLLDDTSSKRTTGTPINVFTGDTEYEFRLRNNTGGEVKATGYIGYTIE